MLDHAKGRIVSDSRYVFHTLARRVLSLNLALSGRFVRLANFCFKTTARIKISRREATFCALAAVALQLCFLRQRDLGTAQVTFFEKCENLSKIKGNHSK